VPVEVKNYIPPNEDGKGETQEKKNEGECKIERVPREQGLADLFPASGEAFEDEIENQPGD